MVSLNEWYHDDRDYLLARRFLFQVVKAGKFTPELYEAFVVWSKVDKLTFCAELLGELHDSLSNRLRQRRNGRLPETYAEIARLITAIRYVRPLLLHLRREWECNMVESLKAFRNS